MKEFRSTVYVLLVLLGTPAYAEQVMNSHRYDDKDPSKYEIKYDLEKCYSLALQQSEIVGEQIQSLAQANEKHAQAVGAMLPTITGIYQYQHQPDIGNALGPYGSQIFPSDQNTAKLSLTQPLFRGLRDLAGLQQTRRLQDVQKYAVEQAKVQLFTDLSQAFYNVASLEKEKIHYEGEIEANQKRLKEVSHFQKTGNAREADTLAIETTTTNLEAQLEDTLGQLNSARQTLAFLTGLKANMQIADQSAPPTSLPDLESFLSHIDERPDVISAKNDLEAAEQAVKVAFGGHLPSADLTGNYYFTRPGALSNVNWDAGVLLSIPIFSGGVTQSQVREASAQRNSKELAYQRVRRQAESDIRSDYDIVEGDLARVMKLEKATKVARKNYEVQVRDYQEGMAKNIDVLAASSADLDTRRSQDKAIYTLKINYAKLQAAAAQWPKQLDQGQKDER